MVLFRIKMPCSYRRSPHILLTAATADESQPYRRMETARFERVGRGRKHRRKENSAHKRNVPLENNITSHTACRGRGGGETLPARVSSTFLPPRALDGWHSEPTPESVLPWIEGG